MKDIQSQIELTKTTEFRGRQSSPSSYTQEGSQIGNNLIRKQCYRIVSGLIDGFLGCGNRRQLPKCVVDGIRTTFPNEDGTAYMGFHAKAVPSMSNEG